MIIFSILCAVGVFVLGMLTLPLVLFLRARRDDEWDNSNMMNIYRVVAHLGAHPSDFALFRYPDGKVVYDFLNKDELSEVTDVRPN